MWMKGNLVSNSELSLLMIFIVSLLAKESPYLVTTYKPSDK